MKIEEMVEDTSVELVSPGYFTGSESIREDEVDVKISKELNPTPYVVGATLAALPLAVISFGLYNSTMGTAEFTDVFYDDFIRGLSLVYLTSVGAFHYARFAYKTLKKK